MIPQNYGQDDPRVMSGSLGMKQVYDDLARMAARRSSVPAKAPAEAPNESSGGTESGPSGRLSPKNVTIRNMSKEAWDVTTTSRSRKTHKDYGKIDPKTGKEMKSWAYTAGKLASKKAFIIHHTGGGGTAQRVINTFKSRNVSSHFIIDRDGQVWRAVPKGWRSQHMRDGKGKYKGLNNSNTESVEIIAKNDEDVNPSQVGAAMGLASQLGYKANQIFGHGEVNTHKRVDRR